MKEISRKARIDIATLLIAIAAVVISLFSLEYSRDAAHSAVAQIRPQLFITCSGLKQSGDHLIGKVSLENIGQTTAVIDDVRLMLYSDQIRFTYCSFLKRAVIYKGKSREADIVVPISYDRQGRKVNYLEQIQNDGGLKFEILFECLEMPDSQFIDSLIIQADLPATNGTRSSQ